jgi:hypothetical protein
MKTKPNASDRLSHCRAEKFMKFASDWRQTLSATQGIFANSHSTLAIRAA